MAGIHHKTMILLCFNFILVNISVLHIPLAVIFLSSSSIDMHTHACEQMFSSTFGRRIQCLVHITPAMSCLLIERFSLLKGTGWDINFKMKAFTSANACQSLQRMCHSSQRKWAEAAFMGRADKLFWVCWITFIVAWYLQTDLSFH